MRGNHTAKRANGEGSVYQRKDGLWAADLSYRTPDGVAKRQTFYSKSQKVALAKLKQARRRLDAGAPVTDSKVALGA